MYIILSVFTKNTKIQTRLKRDQNGKPKFIITAAKNNTKKK